MKMVKRVGWAGIIMLGVLLALLIGSVVIDYVIGRGRIEKVTNTIIAGVGGGPQVRAYVSRPDGEGPFPVVIMIHEFYGLNERITGLADGLAAEGYLVVAADTFRGSSTAWIPRAIYQVISTSSEQVNQDLDSVYAWLQVQADVDPARIGIAGFCYGGRTSLLYSLHNNKLAASVVFYGSPVTDPAVLKSLPGPLLGIFGGVDQSIPLENVRAFEAALAEAGVSHEISIYPDQPHAFIEDMAGVQAGGAQAEAWAQMLKFLEANLKSRSSTQAGQMVAFKSGFDWQYYLMLVYEHAVGTASRGH